MQLRFHKILHIVLSAQALPLICGLLTVFALQVVIVNTDHATKSEEQALQALKYSSAVQKVLLHGLTSLAAYSQTNQESDLKGFYQASEAIDSAVNQLDTIGQNYPFEAHIISDLKSIARQFSSTGNQMIVLQRLGPQYAADRLNELRQGSEYNFQQWGRLNEALTDSLQEHFRLSPVGRASYVSTLSRVLMIGLAAFFVACVLTSRMLTTYIAKRLLVVQDNSARLASGQPLLGRLAGDDEIATLDREFHSMAQAISEATFREKDILENATDIIVTVNAQLVVTSANPACVRLWGEDRRLVGESFLKLVPEESAQSLLRVFTGCRTSGAAGVAEVPLKDALKDTFASISIQWSAENELFSCVLHDITLLKQAEDVVRQSERRLRAMLEEMPAGMLLVNDLGAIIGFNQVAARLINRSSAEVLGMPVNQVLPLGDSSLGAAPVAALESKFLSGRAVLPVAVDKETRHVELSVSRVSLSGSTVYLLVILDITANQKVELLRHQFIDGISDAIVKPLQNINEVLSGLSQFAHKSQEDRFTKFAEAAAQESDRLLKLFSDLLEVESSNVQQLSINKRMVRVQEVFERSVAAVQVNAERRGIDLSFEPTGACINADPDRIVQVLVNLIFNALKFTPTGGYVKLEASDRSQGQVDLRVLDSGPGIPTGMEKQIFEPYKQTKASDVLKKGGSGLGLFICQSIVEKHGGTISATNHSQGAVFTIRLDASSAS
jgi:PAS domain S-box-containing protein